MKIISKYSDYYDSAMGSGYDPTLIFKREGAFDKSIVSTVDFGNSYITRDGESLYFEKKLNPEYFGYGYMPRNKNARNLHNNRRILKNIFEQYSKRNVNVITSEVDVIGFCGRFFVMYSISYFMDYRSEVFRVIDKKNSLFKKLDKKEQDRIVVGEVKDLIRGNANDIFLHLNCPIFHLRPINHSNKIRIIRNPVLQDLGFAAIFDPYTAYQELSMYMGSVFAPSEPDMVDISDKDMSKAKGFDDWSFRKYPTKRKKK